MKVHNSKSERRLARPRVATSVAILGFLGFLLRETAVCFSTPSNRQISSQARFFGQKQQQPHLKVQGDDDQYEYTNNYIMAIEDQSTEPPGLMVSTTDYNYAISSPRLKERDWQSITVNGAQVFILTKDNRTINDDFLRLSESERDFIEEVRSDFTHNLAGLKFAYYTSGSSLAIGESGYQAPGGQQQHSSSASNAIRALSSARHLASLQEAGKRRGVILNEPASGLADEMHYTLKAIPNDDNLDSFLSSRRGITRSRNNRNSSPRLRPPLVGGASVARAPTDSKHGSQAPPYAFPPYASTTRYDNQDASGRPASKQRLQNGLCAFQSLVNFNFYNLNGHQGPHALNRTLTGDIYYFDFHCNILDVYSSTVSVRHLPHASVLYRDYRYFSYARSKLPLDINRFFLVGDQVFFVYNDGSVLLKQSWMLDQAELGPVLFVRQELKNISEWQSKAARLIGGSAAAAANKAQSQDNEIVTTTTTTTSSPTTTESPAALADDKPSGAE